jgi:hypothetical protein
MCLCIQTRGTRSQDRGGDVPAKPLAGKPVLDTGNYYPQRDGQIEVLDNGDYRTINQDSAYDLRVGNRVRLVDGRIYRY